MPPHADHGREHLVLVGQLSEPGEGLLLAKRPGNVQLTPELDVVGDGSTEELGRAAVAERRQDLVDRDAASAAKAARDVAGGLGGS